MTTPEPPWPAPDGSPVGTTGWYLASDLQWHQSATPPADGYVLAPDGRWRLIDKVAEPWRTSRWGLGDCWVGVAAYVVAGLLGALLITVVTGSFDESGELNPFELGALVGLNAVATIGVVWFATRRKGLSSLRMDFGLWGRGRDVFVGLGYGVVAIVTAALASSGVDALLNAEESTSNLPVDDLTSFGEFAIFFIAVAIVTPLIEELFFRGLLFRSLLKRGHGPGRVIITTTLLFIVPHLAAAENWKELLGLTAAIGVFGAVLGTAYHRTGNQLVAPIVAHMAINGLSAIALYAG